MIRLVGLVLALALAPRANGPLLLQLMPNNGGSLTGVTWNLAAGSLRRATAIPAVATARYSPDGKHLAYIVTRGTIATTTLWVANADGSHKRVVARRLPSTIMAWSPDATRIAIAEEAGVVAVAVASGRQVQLAPQVWAEAMAWTSMQTIVFVGHAGACGGVCGVDLATNAVRTIARDDQDHANWGHYWLAASPDGRTVAFVRHCYSGDCKRLVNTDGIVVERSSGTGAHVLVRGEFQTPVWSPDGRQIAYVSTTRARVTLRETTVATGATRTLWTWPTTTAPQVMLLDWRPSAGAR